MHPILLQLGPIPIHTYGVMIAIGFLSALLVLKKLSPAEGLRFESLVDLAFLCLLSGFLGARLLFILTLFKEFAADPVSIFKVWEGGLVFYGGPIAAVPVLLWYTRKKKMNVWKVGDVAVPALTIAHFFGRLGCFGAGCCYGKPTDSIFGVRFTSPLVDPALRGIPLHPTQLYEAFSLFVLFWGLIYVQKTKKFDGQTMLIYLMAYPVIRSLIEIFRGDEIRGFVIGSMVSTSQFISLVVFMIAGVILYQRLRQVHAVSEAS
ncbi:MAG: prolipoprotein diacylglyceryl transferase [Bdellovibrionia bacterium]